MIVKIVKGRRDKSTSFRKLVDYIAFRDEDKLSDVAIDAPCIMRHSPDQFNRIINYIDRNTSSNNDVIATFDDGSTRVSNRGVITQYNTFDLASASEEMRSVAVQNSRCEDPVYHFILSWPPHETPDDDVIFESAQYCLKQLGMSQHQYVAAIHRDTDHIHCHIAVNKINPISYRVASLYQDVEVLHKACRFLELKHGFQPTNGCFISNREGQIVRNKKWHDKMPQKAVNTELHQGVESFYQYVKKNVITLAYKQFDAGKRNTWENIHQIFARYNLSLIKKDNRLYAYNNADHHQLPVSCDKLGFTLYLLSEKLKLGEFKAQINPYNALFSYEKCAANDKDDRYRKRMKRLERRLDLVARYRNYKNNWCSPYAKSESMKAKYQRINKEAQWQKSHVRLVVSDPLKRKLMYHVIEFQKMKAISALRLTLREEKNAIRMANQDKRLTYREWVEKQAIEYQDQAAISQLRGWHYREKRQGVKDATLLIQCAKYDDCTPINLAGYDTQIMKDGSINYLKQGQLILKDYGHLIEFSSSASCRKEDQLAALNLMTTKSGETFYYRGSKENIQASLNLVREYQNRLSLPTVTDKIQRSMIMPAQKMEENKPKPKPSFVLKL